MYFCSKFVSGMWSSWPCHSYVTDLWFQPDDWEDKEYIWDPDSKKPEVGLCHVSMLWSVLHIKVILQLNGPIYWELVS